MLNRNENNYLPFTSNFQLASIAGVQVRDFTFSRGLHKPQSTCNKSTASLLSSNNDILLETGIETTFENVYSGIPPFAAFTLYKGLKTKALASANNDEKKTDQYQ